MNIPKFTLKRGKLYIDKETYNRDVMLVKEYKEDEIERLTNNWNELEKWCKNNLGYYGSDIGVVYKYVLDKMKELQGSEDNE